MAGVNYEARLGDRVRDRVSGFEGVVVMIHRYLQGCDRMRVQPSVREDGVLPENKSFDAPDLKVVQSQVIFYSERRGRDIIGDVNLADRVRDFVSGFEGIAIARHISLTGCDVITVQPPVCKDGKLLKAQVFDAPNLRVLERAVVQYEESEEKRRRTGGPEKYMPGARVEGAGMKGDDPHL